MRVLQTRPPSPGLIPSSERPQPLELVLLGVACAVREGALDIRMCAVAGLRYGSGGSVPLARTVSRRNQSVCTVVFLCDRLTCVWLRSAHPPACAGGASASLLSSHSELSWGKCSVASSVL